MSSNEIRKKFLEFFQKRGHTVVPSSSLVPDDPSVLLTTAGMQQFKPYYLKGLKGGLDPEKTIHPNLGRPVGKNAASVQKSFRTSDIDEVGDESHLTFFEMLGNFSFGGYFKEEAIKYAYNFIAGKEWMGLDIDYVSIFQGDKDVPPDEESEKIWKSLGLKDIRKFGRGDNFWGPTGAEGPCGPTTEIYIKNKNGSSVEIWNLVFNEYYCYPDKRLEKLKTPGVDTGMGLERLAMVSQNTPTIFETDLFKGVFKFVPQGKNGRIFVDHIRASIFLIADGVRPSNKEAGYILRRLMRRAIFHARKITGEDEGGGTYLTLQQIQLALKSGIQFYGNAFGDYRNLLADEVDILQIFEDEYTRFIRTLDDGSKELSRILGGPNKIGGKLPAKDAFDIYQSFGLPREIIKDICDERGAQFDEVGFDEEFKKHQEISRAGQEKKFGGHGLILNTGELKASTPEEVQKVTRLHTATHMLQQALREVLGPEVKQAGSDITAERTRFDFTFPRKLTPEEIKKVEDSVNQKTKESLPMQFTELPIEEAKKTGALYFFKEKYPEKVKVYFIGQNLNSAWSKEFCGGPHVKNTAEIGKFKILKEEAVGSGTRRIRGAVEP